MNNQSTIGKARYIYFFDNVYNDFFFDESHLFFLSFPFLKSLFFEGREVSVNEDRRKEGGKEGGNKSHSRTFYPTILAISITNCFFCFRRRSHSQKGSAPTHQRPEANFEEKKEEKESDTRCHSRAPRVAASGGAIRDRTGQRRVDSRGPSDAA